MIKIDVYNTNGEKTRQISLPEKIFNAKINPDLVARAVRVYRANQRRSGAKVKTRGEVRGSGKKIWRQKGTGRARHGDQYAPIFVGGGVAHGPTGRENYQLVLNRKMKRKALFSVLTGRLKAGGIMVVEGLEKIEPKTKTAATFFDKLIPEAKKILIAVPPGFENLHRATGNLARVRLIQVKLLNPYRVLYGGKLIFLPESIKILEETFLKSKK
ncbi:MAG: 50S ribosomal protein L4 [Candidatus Pacebacteria bacterium]|nr:50S ribosomal protein L4 [Candidatus Paceibacterota bacterium]